MTAQSRYRWCNNIVSYEFFWTRGTCDHIQLNVHYCVLFCSRVRIRIRFFAWLCMRNARLSLVALGRNAVTYLHAYLFIYLLTVLAEVGADSE